MSYLHFLLCDKTSWQKQHKKKIVYFVHNSRVQSITVQKSREIRSLRTQSYYLPCRDERGSESHIMFPVETRGAVNHILPSSVCTVNCVVSNQLMFPPELTQFLIISHTSDHRQIWSKNPSLKLSLQTRLVYVKLTIKLAIRAHVLDCC